MITREQLKQLKTDLAESESRRRDFILNGPLAHALLTAASIGLQAENGWKSPQEPPNDRRQVLIVYYGNRQGGSLRYENDYYNEVKGAFDWMGNAVLAWMEIPHFTPPELAPATGGAAT